MEGERDLWRKERERKREPEEERDDGEKVESERRLYSCGMQNDGRSGCFCQHPARLWSGADEQNERCPASTAP